MNLCYNLKKPQRPEGITIFAKFEFNENAFAESAKATILSEAPSDVNFSASLVAITNDQNSIDELAYKPVISTHFIKKTKTHIFTL